MRRSCSGGEAKIRTSRSRHAGSAWCASCPIRGRSGTILFVRQPSSSRATDTGPRAGALMVTVDARAALLLALADDELVLGQRDAEWTGIAPCVEEDVAFSAIAQDEIGHALALY